MLLKNPKAVRTLADVGVDVPRQARVNGGFDQGLMPLSLPCGNVHDC